jgi:hypothetical protein
MIAHPLKQTQLPASGKPAVDQKKPPRSGRRNYGPLVARTEWLHRTAGIDPDASTRVLVTLYHGDVLADGDRLVAVDDGYDRLRAVLVGAGYPQPASGALSSWRTPGLDLLTGSLEHGLHAAAAEARRSALKPDRPLVFCHVVMPRELLESSWLGLAAAAREGGDRLVLIVSFSDDPAERLRRPIGVLGGAAPAPPCPRGPLFDQLRRGGFAPRLLAQRSFDQLVTALTDARRRSTGIPLALVVD